MMRLPDDETRIALLRACEGSSYAKILRCHSINLSRGTLSRIGRGTGPVSLSAENEVRVALGLAPIIPPTIPHPPCPTCGQAHGYDCGHQRIVRKRPAKKRRRPVRSMAEYATGYCTVGKVYQVSDGEIVTRYFGKVRGDIILNAGNSEPFDTPEEAKAAAIQFRQQAQKALGGAEL